MRDRVNFYTDGFNFYHRIRDILDATELDYRWLDYRALCESLLKPNEILGEVFFFTAIDPRRKESSRRHKVFLQALKSRSVRVIEGEFERGREKMTDVAIASHMLADAYENRFDSCFLLGSDSDFVPAVCAVRKRAGKTVGIVTPPYLPWPGASNPVPPRKMTQLRQSASVVRGAPLIIDLPFSKLNGCGLPPVVTPLRGNKVIRKPNEYALFQNGPPPPRSPKLVRTNER